MISGYLSGTVMDTEGAVLPNVRIRLTNDLTNIFRQTETGEFGFYRFVGVEPGQYSVEFALTGFETRRVEKVTVRTSHEVVIDQVLRVASPATEVYIIEGAATDLSRTIPTIERTFSSRVVAELPIQVYNGVRDISRLALLAPAVARAPSFAEFSANGQRSRNNSFMLDGVDNNDLSVSLNSVRVIPESVAEVQVHSASYSAEFGRSSGAQFSAVTKRGTNEMHGELWEYYRGSWMEPLSLANKRAGIKQTPRFVLNQFGGAVGGALVKNRTFFFGLFDANRRRESPTSSNATSATIPTPSGYSALQTLPLEPGATREARQAVLLALAFMPEIHKSVVGYQNVQAVPVSGVPVEVGSISLPVARPSNFWYAVARIDDNLSSNDTLGYRYHFDGSTQHNFTGNLQFGPRFAADQAIRRQNHAISSTHTFTHRFLNEARLAYTVGRLRFPENAPTHPTVVVSNLFTIGGLSVFPQGRTEELLQFQDVATRIMNRHSLKFGVDVRSNWLLAEFGAHSKGTWTFSSLGDFLNNRALSVIQSVNASTFDASQWNNAFFFQDDIKITRNLTLNVGIRYEYSTVPLGFFGATDPAILAVGVPPPARPDKNNWGPRVGFAYSPGNKTGVFGKVLGNEQTSIRAGFGVHYDVLFYGLLSATANNYPRVVTSTTTTPATANLFPTLPPKVAATPPLDPLTSTFVNVPEDIQRPTTNLWSLSLQRQIGASYVLELGYIGSRSYHQIRQRDANPGVLTADQAAAVLAGGSVTIRRLNPNWGPRTLFETAAKAEYHAGYLKFDRRVSSGLFFGASYTWSANFSDNDEAFGPNNITSSSPAVPQNFFDFRKEWSRSAFDVPHRFTVHYLYEVPWFSNRWAHRALERVFGGWQVSGVIEAQSGQPFTIRTGVDTVGSLSTAFPGRPNYRPDGIFVRDTVSRDLRTFRIPLDGSGIVYAPMGPAGILANSMPGGGDLGRNTFRGPSFQNWNISLMKIIPFGEAVALQIRGDVANLWNHNNFQNPVAVMNSPTFGQNTAPLITDTRQILLSAKLKF